AWGWWMEGGDQFGMQLGQLRGGGWGRGLGGNKMLEGAAVAREGAMPMFANAPAPAGAVGGGAIPKAMPMEAKADRPGDSKTGGGSSAQPTHLREYFPETMLWQPALITDDQGRAELPVQFADSITTWRLSASASSKYGSLGGVTAPLRVFQDF